MIDVTVSGVFTCDKTAEFLTSDNPGMSGRFESGLVWLLF
jgi:hypothetical protein